MSHNTVCQRNAENLSSQLATMKTSLVDKNKDIARLTQDIRVSYS